MPSDKDHLQNEGVLHHEHWLRASSRARRSWWRESTSRSAGMTPRLGEAARPATLAVGVPAKGPCVRLLASDHAPLHTAVVGNPLTSHRGVPVAETLHGSLLRRYVVVLISEDEVASILAVSQIRRATTTLR